MEHLSFQYGARSNNSKCSDFKDISVKTWNILANSFETGIGVSEETITDVNLLELNLRQPEIYVRKYRRWEEGINGADWLWAFVGRSGQTILLYVQAKRIFPSGRYESLLHGEDGIEQLNKLIFNKFFYPLGLPVFPIYVFYNYFPSPLREIGCNNCSRALRKELSGFAYADAFSLLPEMRAGRDSLEILYKYQSAVSCIFCCGPGGGEDNAGFLQDPDLAENVMANVVNVQAYAREMSNTNSEYLDPYSFVMPKAPGFVNRIIDGQKDEKFPLPDLDVEQIMVVKQK